MGYFFRMAVGLAILAVGCGQSRPTMVGGKPVQEWRQALQDPNPKTRKKAATKLGNAGAVDSTVIPALVGALQDRDAGVRAEAVLALLRIGPAAREAFPALREMARTDKDARVRAYAAKALEKLQDDS
ncbi:MAG TPA: HEAT repeat domain-containing protein [Bryobacteraceae bacterium]